MVRIPVYLKKWQQNGLFEETANALRLRFPEKEFDAGTAAAQVAEILHNLGYKKLFMSKMPESRFGIDGFPFIATFASGTGGFAGVGGVFPHICSIFHFRRG